MSRERVRIKTISEGLDTENWKSSDIEILEGSVVSLVEYRKMRHEGIMVDAVTIEYHKPIASKTKVTATIFESNVVPISAQDKFGEYVVGSYAKVSTRHREIMRDEQKRMAGHWAEILHVKIIDNSRGGSVSGCVVTLQDFSNYGKPVTFVLGFISETRTLMPQEIKDKVKNIKSSDAKQRTYTRGDKVKLWENDWEFVRTKFYWDREMFDAINGKVCIVKGVGGGWVNVVPYEERENVNHPRWAIKDGDIKYRVSGSADDSADDSASEDSEIEVPYISFPSSWMVSMTRKGDLSELASIELLIRKRKWHSNTVIPDVLVWLSDEGDGSRWVVNSVYSGDEFFELSNVGELLQVIQKKLKLHEQKSGVVSHR